MSNPLAMPQVIEANGLRFGYHSLGEGPLVLLLHGFPDTAKAWDEILAPVASAGFQAVAPYLRGYSPTEAPANDASTDELGADVIALIDAFGAEAATVVGHDWGGAAAYAAAALAPDRVSRLVTVALPHPAGFKPKITDLWPARHFLTFRRKSAPSKFVAKDFKGLREIYRRWSPNWDVTDADLADIKRCLSNPESLNAIFGYYRSLQRTPSDLMRRRISVPTAAIAGRSDGAVPVRAFEEAASRFTGEYEVLELPGGHFPHRENTDAFTQMLLAAIGG
ncbi:MAG: alpha/beta hydrolase [bacterium]|nr:alpha/beta hydrolase [bacterium]